MLVSGCLTSQLRGDLLSSLLGAPRGLHRICLLACVKGHFARLFSSFFSLSTLPLVSIGSGKYSTDWVQCECAFGGGRSQGCHGYLLPRASLLPGSTNLFRHQLPSSSIVDEFNFTSGTFSDVDATDCTACPPGFACPNTSDSTQQIACTPGTYAIGSKTLCEICPPAKHCPSRE